MEAYQDQSLRGKVFQKLREDILSGVYQDGEELREAAIGEELGVSRTPVREALRQLELEGLVTLIPNRGAYVTGITHKDVQDIYNPLYAGGTLCQMGHGAYYREADRSFGGSDPAVRILSGEKWEGAGGPSGRT